MLPLSVLDLAPIVEGGTAAQAFRNALDLAQHAERWGYNRYWLAEHHNMTGIANSAVLGLWDDLGPRWKDMLKATNPDATPPNMRKDLHLVLELAHELGVTLYLGSQGSLVADAGVATGHGDSGL